MEEAMEIIGKYEQLKVGNSTEQLNSEIRLPSSLENFLAFRLERTEKLGVDAIPAQTFEQESHFLPPSKSEEPCLMSLMTDDADDDLGGEEKETKRKRNKKKKKKRQRASSSSVKQFASADKGLTDQNGNAADPQVQYIQEILDVSDPIYSQFTNVFEKFKLIEPKKSGSEVPMDTSVEGIKQETTDTEVQERKRAKSEDDDKKDECEKSKLSKRKTKKLSRMTVAELKQKVVRPDLAEIHDVTAKDPLLLLHLKAYRNTVPVPRHWCFKRKYLQGKRGIEKPPFELPDFIKRTGIMEIRQAFQEKEDQNTMKGKMRNKVRPKLGSIEIEYQVLHDAFFKWQTKPKMTIHGDLYYEGKESETRFKDKKPGNLSEELRIALGMPTGPNANKCPPPWLIAMQRYGPPPSYRDMKVPGLNAPVPDGCSFGYHAGGWGKPPVDEAGKPLYGDVFGTQISESQPQIQKEEFHRTLWGELESESSEEEDDDDDEMKAEDETGLATPAEGLITPSGCSTVLDGMETPDMIEIRKERIEADMEGGETPSLYIILPEKRTERIGSTMMGSTHIYDFAAAVPAGRIKMPATESVPNQGIEVALDPSELELESAAMEARYEQTIREQQPPLEKEDLSDMVAEHTARQKKKRKRTQDDSGKPPKKYKEFKF